MTTIRIAYATEDELNRKLIVIMQRRGFHVEPATPEPVTVAQLARIVGRSTGGTSRALHRASCPAFAAQWGRGTIRRRILRITPNSAVLRFLTLNP